MTVVYNAIYYSDIFYVSYNMYEYFRLFELLDLTSHVSFSTIENITAIAVCYNDLIHSNVDCCYNSN